MGSASASLYPRKKKRKREERRRRRKELWELKPSESLAGFDMPDDRAVLPGACRAIAAAACRVWWWLYRISCFALFSLSHSFLGCCVEAVALLAWEM
jgi:hypothetical protein